MRIFGLEIVRVSKSEIAKRSVGSLQSVNTWRSVMGYVRESFTGAWQQGVVVDRSPSTLLAFSAVFACVSGIASDISKMRIKLIQKNGSIWDEVDDPHGNSNTASLLKLLTTPNDFQNRIQFIEAWIISKLLYGNSYVLKQRDREGNVTALYILHPLCVTPLVASDGGVYYSLNQDYLSEVSEGKTVPASEIIHDRANCLFHPLIGVSPLYACAMSVTMGNKIQSNSTAFFANGSTPGGVVTIPGEISDDTAVRLKTAWESNYGGINNGRVAILGDGMTFNPVRMQNDQAQLIDQLKFTVSDVARTFHYPEFKLGGPLPPYASNLGTLITSYYTDCLQSLIESLELCLDLGLGLASNVGIEMDLEGLLRMDGSAIYESNSKGVTGGWLAPNEARRRLNLKPLTGGDSAFLQQQNWSLEQLSKRTGGPADADNAIVPPAPDSPARSISAEGIRYFADVMKKDSE